MSTMTLIPLALHLVHDPVEPFEGELALRGFEGIPGQVAHADDIESGMPHDGDVAINLFGRAVDRLIAGAHKELSTAWPGRVCEAILGGRRRTPDHQNDEALHEVLE